MCIAHEMNAALYLYRDFYETYNSHQNIETSLRELCDRRESQKALVKMTSKEFLALIQMTNKEFPSIHDLAGVFDAADLHKTCFFEIDKVKSVLKAFDGFVSVRS